MSLLDDLFNKAKAETSIATELIKRGRDTLEEIADLCKMSLTSVQELAKSLGK